MVLREDAILINGVGVVFVLNRIEMSHSESYVVVDKNEFLHVLMYKSVILLQVNEKALQFLSQPEGVV